MLFSLSNFLQAGGTSVIMIGRPNLGAARRPQTGRSFGELPLCQLARGRSSGRFTAPGPRMVVGQQGTLGEEMEATTTRSLNSAGLPFFGGRGPLLK